MNINKLKKATALFLAMTTMAVAMTGCTDKEAEKLAAEQAKIEASNKELRQNDYRGGVLRTLAMKDMVLSLVDEMKANNAYIRKENPNAFWSAEGYQEFVTTFLSYPIIEDTIYFNEEQTDWDKIVSTMCSVQNSFTKLSDGAYVLKYPEMLISRIEKDDYSVSNLSGTINNNPAYKGMINYRILYDCDKDWCKAYKAISPTTEVPDLTAEMYEYARINNDTYAVQTSKERLVVVFETVSGDTDLKKREIKEFYYSKLVNDGVRTTFTPYEPVDEYDAHTGKPIQENISLNKLYTEKDKFDNTVNEKGDLSFQYGKNDSLFYNDVNAINHEWVFEDKSLQQAIVYKDNTLVVTTFNKLSEKYERFIYKRSGVTDETIKEIENMVEINKLVGIKEVEATEKADFIVYNGKTLYPVYENDILIGYMEGPDKPLYTLEMIQNGTEPEPLETDANGNVVPSEHQPVTPIVNPEQTTVPETTVPETTTAPAETSAGV